MPSTTTQILFNSPALHSLKRDQLVKLCKIHSIKASGKNVELIQKLKKHAETLPKDDPLSIAVRAESTERANETKHKVSNTVEAADNKDMAVEAESSSSSTPEGSQPSRPPLNPTLSDWEVVMYSIEEEDETQGTVGSTKSGHRGAAGEFGTSSKSTVGSSIKALANSIGKLKKGSPKRKGSVRHSTHCDSDELEKHSRRYDSLPPSVPPRTDDPLDFNPARMSTDGFLAAGESPLPGHALRPGVPAPENGRLSLGLGSAPPTPSLPTTTIRLIGDRKTPEPADPTKKPVAATPQLKPFETTFDLIMGSPGGSDGSGVPGSSIYPTLTFNDLPPSLTSMAKAAPALLSSSTTPLPGGASEPPAPQPERVVPGSLSNDDPFVFGSPLPKHRVSDAQFKSAAASVLEEMNKRLQVDGVEGVDTGLIGRLHAGAHKASLPPKQVNPLPKGEMKEKFDQVHKQEFQKMEGIDAFVKRKEAVKDGMTAPAIIGKKRKSSVVPREGPRRQPGTRISGARAISNGRRAMPIPGAFGTEDDEDETQDGEQPEERAGKRIRVASDTVGTKDSTDAGSKQIEEEEQAAREKERQVIKRKLEMNRARRRSSTAPGLHGKRVSRPSMSAKSPQKPKSGFLSSAKSLVANVLGRGRTDAATSNAIPRPIAQSKPATSLLKKAATPAKPTATQSSRPTGVKVNSESTLNKPTAASSARLRSPIPTFGLGSARGNVAPTTNALTPAATTARKTSGTAMTGSRVSSSQSMGTRASAQGPNAGAVGSMGNKIMSSGVSSQSSRVASNPSSSSRLPVTSRLFSPTASSLAKMGKASRPGSKPVAERLTPAQALKSPPGFRRNAAALDIITNSPAVGKAHAALSPTKGMIFSQPLQLIAPTPAKKEGAASVLSPGNDDAKSPSIRQLSMNGKRPRVSRSKVIAKLASQRAAGTSATLTTPGPRASVAATPRRGTALAPKSGAKSRSSLGAKVVRNSIAGAKVADGPTSGVMLSAKKRVRQSEYYRRRSVAVGSSPLKPRGQQSAGGNEAMDVDQ